MSDGTLSVDLRLALKKLREDITAANKMIKDGLGKSINLGGAAKDTKDSGAAMDNLAIKTKRATSALEQQLAAWKKLQNFRKPTVTDNSGNNPAGNRRYGPGAIINDVGFTGSEASAMNERGRKPYSGPPPPVIPGRVVPVPPAVNPQDAAVFWRRILTGGMAAMRGGAYGKVIAGNQFFGAFGSTQTGASAMGGVGLAGVGGAAVATGGLIIALMAVKGALELTRKVLQETIAASERARVLYAKSLQSGLGTGFTAQRANLASVLGVSEEQVYQFGVALAVLNPKLEWASKISADAAASLAPLSYELRILKLDIEAAFTVIAMDLAPTIRTLIQLFDALTQSMVALYNGVLKPMLTFIVDTVTSAAGKAFIGSVATQAFGSQIAELMATIGSLIGIGNASQTPMPQPQAFMKQMPVSSMERMGLVAGMGSSPLVDYSRRTAVATETIAKHVAGMANNGGVTRAFNLDPNVANP